jgi:7-cyano-7-deazaguanine synthase in queuosine biosynthesis
MNRFELLPVHAERQRSNASVLRWPAPGSKSQTVITDLEWDATQLGGPHPAAVDLLRIAAAAYLCDRLTRRPRLGFGRSFELSVHVNAPELWRGAAGQTLVNLLAWISGDEWILDPVQAAADPATPDVGPVPDREDVMLLSGGLDSLCGAIDQWDTSSTRLHVGHRDIARATRHAQSLLNAWLQEKRAEFSWTRHELAQAGTKRENSTRTRSLLFMALGIAAASGAQAQTVIVPENGFTSMNVPILPSRGGALSTKSTHPWTFHLLEQLLQAAGLPVSVHNPYLSLTKGELLDGANTNAPTGFIDAAGRTLSCSKLDGGRFKGGDPNLNCGLCIACLVRRGSFIAAGISDPTPYLVDRLDGPSRQQLIDKRRDDLWAIRVAQELQYTEDDLIASAAWPPGTDLDTVLDVVNRGRMELFDVPLP